MSPGAVAAAILAGGASTRFGSDKTAARLGARTLLERVADALRSAEVDPVALIGAREPSPPHGLVPVVDRHPREGPLGGIVTALHWSPVEWTVVVAADLPLLDELTVRALADRAQLCPGAVAMARAGGRLQPTCACWPASARQGLEERFDRGERSIAGALSGLVDVGLAVEPVDVPARVVGDVDTPADLAVLAERWSR